MKPNTPKPGETVSSVSPGFRLLSANYSFFSVFQSFSAGRMSSILCAALGLRQRV